MNQMTGSLVQSASRVLHEELQFDKKRVTSRDWVSYPILRFKDTPKVTTVIVQPADRDASGSGEPPRCRSALRSRTRSSTPRACA